VLPVGVDLDIVLRDLESQRVVLVVVVQPRVSIRVLRDGQARRQYGFRLRDDEREIVGIDEEQPAFDVGSDEVIAFGDDPS
jgi:hypothetical protein